MNLKDNDCARTKKNWHNAHMNDYETKTEFLKAKYGDTDLIGEDEIAKALTFIGGSNDQATPTLFQTANVDKGEIHWVKAEEVRGIFSDRNS